MKKKSERKFLEDVFGESSSSDSDTEQQFTQPPTSLHNSPLTDDNKRGLIISSPPPSPPSSSSNPKPYFQRISEINGLWLCPNFLSSHQQSSLLSSIHNEGWFTEASHNQAMRFGDLPYWALELSDQIHELICFGEKQANNGMLNFEDETYVLPPQLLFRDPLFDQLIANVYQPGEGICAHVDLMRFEDGIAIVSLESACVMHFSLAERNGEVPVAHKVPVYLTPGSLVIIWGDARYQWKHEINRKPGFQVWQGHEIDQKRRTSITLRKLCVS